MKAAVYLRVSSNEQSTDNQFPVLEAYAKNRNYEIVRVYEEEESAWKSGHQRELANLIVGIFLLLGALMRIISSGKMSAMAENFGMQWDRGPWFTVSVIFGITLAGVVIYSATVLNSKPAQHVAWGTLIIISSVMSALTSWGGFGIGMVLGIIGGALAITSQSLAATPQQSRSTSIVRYCPQCGSDRQVNSNFYPYCGKQLVIVENVEPKIKEQ